MAECASCGRTLSEIARFCPACGAPVVAQAPEARQTTPPDGAAEPSATPVVAPVEPAPAAAAHEAVVEPSADPPEHPVAEPVAEPPVTSSGGLGVGPPVTSSGEPEVEPLVTPSVTANVEPAVESAIAPAAAKPAAASAEQRTCAACGAAAPAEDLFCGDCGAPLDAVVAAEPTSPVTQAPVIAAPPGAGARTSPSPAGYRPRAGVEDYLSFRALWITTNAAVLFWIAEGANLVYWILDWVVSNRWNGAQGFFWSAAGFVLFAIIIRIVTEGAAAAARGAEARSPQE